MHILGLIISVLIGIVLGLVGGGGSILTVPLVNYFFDTSMLMATTYSLIVVTASSLFGVMQRISSGDINFKIGIYFAIPSMLIAFSIRYWIMPLFPIQFSILKLELSRDLVITTLLIIVMLFTAINMLRKKHDENKVHENHNFFHILIFGIITGMLSGFIGAGGGFIIVPILMQLGLTMRSAVGTSMFIITIQSLVALIGDFFNPEIMNIGIDWKLVGLLTILTIAGVFIGTKLHKKVPTIWLSRIFSFVLMLVAIGMLIKLLNN